MQILGIVLAWLTLVVVFSLIGTVPVYFLWNWLMPSIFGLNAVTFWQALGLLFLSSILFKSNSTTKEKR